MTNQFLEAPESEAPFETEAAHASEPLQQPHEGRRLAVSITARAFEAREEEAALPDIFPCR